MAKYKVSGLLNYMVWEAKQIEIEVEAGSEYEAMCKAGADESGFMPTDWNDYFYFEEDPDIELVGSEAKSEIS